MPKRLDITPGQRFTYLIAIAYRHSNGSQKGQYWAFNCDCGAEVTLSASQVKTGHTKSCGCYRRTHGLSRTGIGKTWFQMMNRCYNSKKDNHKNYGARGIIVHPRWHSLENFYADMGPRPPGHSIDRYPDNGGNYEPGNCRWATPKQQANNRRRRRKQPPSAWYDMFDKL